MSRLQLSWQEHRSTLVSLVQTFWGNDLLVDCTLAAEGKYLKAHKIILSACSPYFQLLFSQESEKNPIVILKDVQFECLKWVLDFVYFGEVLVRESQLSTFLEVARSLQIKGLDSNDKEASQKKAQSTRSSRKDSTSRPIKYEASEEVIDVDDDCKVIKVVDRIAEASSSQPSHAPSPSVADDARTITIESAYSIATSARSAPELCGSVNTGAPECPLYSAPPSVASSVPDSADAVQSSKVLESNNLKSDPDKNSLVKESPRVSGTGNIHGESSVINSSGTDEGTNNGVTPDCSDDNSSGKRRKQSSSTGPAKRRVFNRSDLGQKSLKIQLSRTELATLPGKVTPSERSEEAISVSSKDAVESSKEAESTSPKSSVNSGEALSRVLSIVLSKAKIPASAFVPYKTPASTLPAPTSAPPPSPPPAPAPAPAPSPAPARAPGTHPPVTYSGPNAKRKRRYLKRHTCPDCNKQFLRPSYLLIHRRRHTGEKPHICPICNKCFAQPGALKRHGTLHTGDRPYTCEYCLKRFNRSSTLKIHLRLHTGERPYECPDCGKTFVAHSQLWSHKRVHMEGPYKCDACGESFKRKPLLVQHWFLVHEQGEVIHTLL